MVLISGLETTCPKLLSFVLTIVIFELLGGGTVGVSIGGDAEALLPHAKSNGVINNTNETTQKPINIF